MYYTQEQIDRANQADLVSFLQGRGEQLTRAGQEYRWKRHDSLTVRGNKWYRHSQSKGGGPVDFVMEFFGKSFTCLLYTSPSPRDGLLSRMPSSA